MPAPISQIEAKVRADRLVRTEVAIERVSDWALRMARNVPEKSLIEYIDGAINELTALKHDLSYQYGTFKKPEKRDQVRWLTQAGSAIIQAVALLTTPSVGVSRKKHEQS